MEAILGRGGEVGLHGSYRAAGDGELLARELETLAGLGAEVRGQRYHYLRVDPHANLSSLPELGFRYDTSLGFPDAPGFRAGIAQPFRPWDFETETPLDLVEIPLAAMDVTLGESRYLGLSAEQAERPLLALLDQAAEHGGGYAVLWHTDRFDRATAQGWDRLYVRFLDAVRERGGVCLPAGELAAAADVWLGGGGSWENPGVPAAASTRAALARSGAYRSLRRALRAASHPRELADRRRIRRRFEDEFLHDRRRSASTSGRFGRAASSSTSARSGESTTRCSRPPGETATPPAASASRSGSTCMRSCAT